MNLKLFISTLILSSLWFPLHAYAQEMESASKGIDWTLIRDLVVVVLAAGVMVYLKRGKKETPKEKAVEWFQPKEIDTDGFIVTEDDRYMMMLHVQPIPFVLKSPQEQRAIWLTFREWLSMMTHPVRFRVESHPYDLQAYFHELRTKAIEMGDMLNIQYVQEQEQTFNQVIQDQKIQDQRCYLILETDYRYLNDMSGLITNPLFNDFVQRFRKGQQADYREIAKQELQNSLRVTLSTLENIKLFMTPMNRQDVLKYLHGAVNRETARFVPFHDFVQRVAGVDEETISLSNLQVRSDSNVLEKKKTRVTA
ncbi:hypothetical protein [Brevibacillus marinus]|uniref:hypothetical protein n=1 Tax=Brevibacillus marinus TaxID=2496837 RepID=UPI000F84E5E1|nr:hypothetical protein [Brevibacillus marinus]